MTGFSAVRYLLRYLLRRVGPLALTILCCLLHVSARAQDAGAVDQDCPPAPATAPPSLPSNPCIILDARKSVDSLAGPVTFRWQMGDGQTREGVTFEYCYAALGRYVIQLDVLDQTTGEVRLHETERVVNFAVPQGPAPEPMLQFTAPAKAKVGEPVEFKLVTDLLPACLPATVRYNWNFRDGLLGQGRTVTHSFRRAGTFAVRFALDGWLEPGCLRRTCVSRTIVIE